MASRVLAPSFRALSARPGSPLSLRAARKFQTSTRKMDTATVAAFPTRKPVGAFRGGLLGFLTGTVLAGAGTYYYILDEYRISNEMLTEDIYALQAAVQRVHAYLTSLEEKVDALSTK